MNILRIIVIFVLSNILGGSVVYAQNFWDRIHLRQNLNVEKDVPQPAFIQITGPVGKKAVMAVGVGLRVDLVNTALLEIGPSLEYLRNDDIEKIQNSIKVGVSTEWQILEITNVDKKGNTLEKPRKQSPILISKIAYKNDKVKNAESIQLDLSYTHIFRGGAPLPNTGIRVGNMLDFKYAPYLGFEYENIIKAAKEKPKGAITRALGRIELSIWPAGKSLSRQIEFTLGYQFRKDIFDDINKVDDDHPLFSASLNLYFVKDDDRKAGISFKYTNGENPSDGLEKQEFYQVGFTAQLK